MYPLLFYVIINKKQNYLLRSKNLIELKNVQIQNKQIIILRILYRELYPLERSDQAGPKVWPKLYSIHTIHCRLIF